MITERSILGKYPNQQDGLIYVICSYFQTFKSSFGEICQGHNGFTRALII